MRKNWRNKLTVGNGQLTMSNRSNSIKEFLPAAICRLSIILLLILTSCTNDKEQTQHHDTYTCPMHPTVVSDKQGTCPVCGMDLVRKVRPGEEVKITEDLARLIKSPNEVVVASIKTVKGEFKSMPISVAAQGIVTYDTRNTYTISARIGGRLEKIFLKYAFQPVRKGQRVAEIYSPELLTAQRELLYLIENDPGNTIIESAKSKLYLLGATPRQVNDMISRKDVTSTFTVYSPYDGYVIAEAQQVPSVTKPSSSSAMGGGMGGSSAGTSSTPVTTSGSTPSAEMIREGSYVTTGQTLFKIVNPSALRVELDLSTSQAGRLNQKDDVDLDLGDNKIVKGKVDFVQPFFSEGEEFVKVRLYVRSSGELQIGQLVTAKIQLKAVEALWVPREAVLDLGLDHIVFIKEHRVFKPKKVTAGVRADGLIQIVQGLSSSDEIAFNAQYLVDSESFVKARN